jgi:hypothetical protein
MAKLTAAQRRNIPKSQMGVPGKSTKKGGAVSGSFPMPDKKHARAAIMLSGHAAPAKRAAIKAKARRILAK